MEINDRLTALIGGLLLLISSVAYMIEVIITHTHFTRGLSLSPSSPFRHFLLLSGPITWALATVFGGSVSNKWQADLDCSPSLVDPDVAGIGIRVSLFVNAAAFALSALLGVFHTEEVGVLELASVLWLILVTFIFNVWKLYLRRGSVLDCILGLMMTDSYISLLSVSSAMRDRLAEPWTTSVGLVTQSVGLFTIAFMVDRIPNLGRSGSVVDGQCRCYRLFWWGTFDTCSGASMSFWLFFSYRVLSWMHECWLWVRLTQLYKGSWEAKRSGKTPVTVKNITVSQTVFDSLPATASMKFLEAVCCVIGTITFIQITLKNLGIERVQEWNSWGQTAQLFAAAWVLYRWLKRVCTMFSEESVLRRQEILERASTGTRIPQLLRAQTLSAGPNNRIISELQKVYHRHPFGSYPPRRQVDHARLTTPQTAWNTISLEFLQWPTLTSDEKGQMLVLGSKQGDIQLIGDLLIENAPVNYQDGDGNSALVHAATQGHTEVVRRLLLNAADSDLSNTSGSTALHIAVEQGNLGIFSLLCSQSNLDSRRNTDGYSALCIAARFDFGRICSILLRHGADPYLVDNHLQTPLHIAIRYGRDDIVEHLLKRRMNPNNVDADGWTALHIAARYERDVAGSLLLEARADLEIRDIADNWTPFEVAIRWGRQQMAAQMIQHGVNYHIVSESVQRTALNLSLFYGREDVSAILIAKGVDTSVRNRANESPLYIAASRRRRAMCLLSDNGAQITEDEKSLFVTLLITARMTKDDAEDLVKSEGSEGVISRLMAVHRP